MVNERERVACAKCGTTQTPNWRLGHRKVWLCNECGVEYKKQTQPPPPPPAPRK